MDDSNIIQTSDTSKLLQVLTANLGHILDVKGTEQGLTDFKGTSTLTFDQFRYYVQTEVCSALPDQVNKICHTLLKRDSFCYAT